ncbi:MAG: hypothetical protein ACFB4I_04200 [Cyanophyceae cyanobacterium]
MNSNHLPKPHRRQFIIGPSPLSIHENWQYRSLNNGWISYCPELRISWSKDRNGIEWGLIGLAVETRSAIDPKEQISQATTAQVIHRYASWAGRWLLVGNREIHLDANGLLGCFYGMQSADWVSSSPALISQALKTAAKDERCLKYGQGISWYTPPYSGFKQINRLLPSQILNFTTGEISPRPLMPKIDQSNVKQTITLVKETLVTALQNLGTQQQPLWLGLTAGYDSRLMLAIARQANIKFTTFTRVAERMSVADRILPPKLAKQCQVPHLFLRHKPPPEQLARKQLVQQHCASHVSPGDAEPFVMRVREGLAGISFGGHGWAIASGFHTLRQLPKNFASPHEGALQIAKLFNEPAHSSAVAGMMTWLTWVQSHPQPDLDWRDRFFLEQRQAGWLSSKEQVYDLTSLTRFPILNAARTYALLLSIPEAQRLGSLVQIALLEQLAPELLTYPFNPPDDSFPRWLKVAVKMRDRPQYLSWWIKQKLSFAKC